MFTLGRFWYLSDAVFVGGGFPQWTFIVGSVRAMVCRRCVSVALLSRGGAGVRQGHEYSACAADLACADLLVGDFD